MFRIVDGRESFYQWDLNRQIEVLDPTITEVHFCNRTDNCSLVVEVEETTVYSLNAPEIVIRTANVPNIILQSSFDIRVFGYDGEATRHDKVFKVNARTKPADYVYTETEIKNYDELKERIDEIEKNGFSEEVVAEAVDNYFEKNPIEVTGYATEEYVDKAIEAIPEPEKVDLTPYAKKEDIPDISDFISKIPEEYITETELNAKGYLTEHQDLTNYAKLSDIPTRVGQLSNDRGYITQHQDISHLATIGQVQKVEEKIPTKTSDLTNDRGFLTEHQDLSGKADKEHTHSSYALKEHSHSEYLTEHQSLEGYATEQYVDDAITNAGAGADLSNYYTKDETYSKTEVDEAIANIDIPEGGSKRVLTYKSGRTLTEGEVNTLLELWQKCRDGENILTQNEIFIRADYSWNGSYYTTFAATGFYAFYNSDIKWVTLTGVCTNLSTPASNPNFGAFSVNLQLTKSDGTYNPYAKISLNIFERDNYYTKTDIDAMFEGIAQAEGGAY